MQDAWSSVWVSWPTKSMSRLRALLGCPHHTSAGRAWELRFKARWNVFILFGVAIDAFSFCRPHSEQPAPDPFAPASAPSQKEERKKRKKPCNLLSRVPNSRDRSLANRIKQLIS